MIDTLIRRDAIPCMVVESNNTPHSGHCILTGQYVVVITNKIYSVSGPAGYLLCDPILAKYPQHRFVICSSTGTPVSKNNAPYVGFVIQITNHTVIVFPFSAVDYARRVRQAILHNKPMIRR